MTIAQRSADGIGPAPPQGAGPVRRRRRVPELVLLLAPVLLLVVVVFDYPILNTIYWSVLDEETGRLTGAHFAEFWESRAYMRIIWRTLVISAEVMAMTLCLYALYRWLRERQA